MNEKTRIGNIKKIEKHDFDNIELVETTDHKTRFINNTFLHIFLIIIIGFLSYANTFHVPFQWDEGYFIVDNPIVKDIGFFTEPSNAHSLGNRYMHLKSRYVGYLTFALNYRINGTNVTGYHIVNFAIHISAAVLVYVLVLLTFRTPFLERSMLKRHASYIALFSGLLFVAHPIQTEAVTYIFQRLASLGAFLYLLSLTAYISSRLSTGKIKKYVYFTVSLISAILAMKTKENTFTLPFVIVLFEFAFFTGLLRSRIFRLIPFGLTLLIIPFTMIEINRPLGEIITDIGSATADTEALSRGDYFFTQMRVIPTYIRLLLFPVNQNLDYSYQISDTLFTPQVFLSTVFLISLIGLAIYLYHRSRFAMPDLRIIAFGIFWFFITLSVESSIIPLNTIINEYRLYLPSVGFFILLTAGVFLFTEKFRNRNMYKVTISSLIFLTLLLSYLAYSRNALWVSNITLWEDVARKSPNNLRAHNNLGSAYMVEGNIDKAIEQYQIALRLNPEVAGTHNNIGNAYMAADNIDKAIEQYQIALRLNPEVVRTHNNLGSAYMVEGNIDKAIEQYQIALRLNPEVDSTHDNLGSAYMSEGNIDKAIEQYQIALRLNPEVAGTHNNLGNAYKFKGLIENAIEQYQIALRLKPDYAGCHFNLGLVFLKKGNAGDALKEFEIVLKLNPDDYEAKHYIDLISKKKSERSQLILTGGSE